ncbi:MAG: Fur family transcriptional regulator [Bacteroidales bacterium]
MSESHVEKFFKSKKLRLTAMRLLIFKSLLRRSNAFALTDVENELELIDRTTLYRTIKKFEEKGIVHQIDDGTGIIKYALCKEGCTCDLENDLHLHFHCVKCGETTCLTDYRIPKISIPEGFVAENVNLVVKGVCNKCNQK